MTGDGSSDSASASLPGPATREAVRRLSRRVACIWDVFHGVDIGSHSHHTHSLSFHRLNQRKTCISQLKCCRLAIRLQAPAPPWTLRTVQVTSLCLCAFQLSHTTKKKMEHLSKRICSILLFLILWVWENVCSKMSWFQVYIFDQGWLWKDRVEDF